MFRQNFFSSHFKKFLAMFVAMTFNLISVDAAQLYWNYYNSYETCAADQPGKNFCNRISSNSEQESRSHNNCSFCQCNDPAEFLQLTSLHFSSFSVFEPEIDKVTVLKANSAEYYLLLFQELAPPS